MDNKEIRKSNRSLPAISIRGLRKQYRLGSIGRRTLQADLQSWWARRSGKEDPNIPIGFDEKHIGEYFWALDGIDLEISRGERIGIIGHNGAGKSTLLKILCRITAPTEGEAEIWGRVTSMLEVGTGFHREMTGRENIYMNGAILGMTRTEIDDVISDIIEFSEVGEFIDTPVKRYSSGMFVKLAFSVASHLNSEIMIMDEVLAVGDIAFQEKCLNRMRTAAEDEGRTILYVSHNMSTIRRLCDRCIVMDHGHIIYDGEPDKAIAIYMDHNIGDSNVDIDLTQSSHNVKNKNNPLMMTRLQLVGKDLAVYDPGETMRLRLTVKATNTEHDVCVRLTLRTDGDVGLGTTWTKPVTLEGPESIRDITDTCNNNEGNENFHKYELTLELPLKNMAKGVFYGSIGLYSRPVNGRQRKLDHISRAFRIEIPGKTNWNTNAHGYMELPEMSISVDQKDSH